MKFDAVLVKYISRQGLQFSGICDLEVFFVIVFSKFEFYKFWRGSCCPGLIGRVEQLL